MITKILRVIAVSAALWGGSVAADPGCQNADVISGKLITDVCWSCIFPIKIAGVPISGPGGSYPDDSAKNPLCLCNDNLGKVRTSTLHNKTENFSRFNSNAYKGIFLYLVTYSHLP
uniref:TraU family protein n=1 Tax=Aeromonas caviae TaxID=648 RepID=UPI0021C41705|nr:TraU family protein [Aeromonas caviae]